MIVRTPIFLKNYTNVLWFKIMSITLNITINNSAFLTHAGCIMDGYAGIAIRYGGSFYRIAQEKQHYRNGTDKVKLIKNTCIL